VRPPDPKDIINVDLQTWDMLYFKGMDARLRDTLTSYPCGNLHAAQLLAFFEVWEPDFRRSFYDWQMYAL
jgi:hypothetical protein